MRTGLPSFMAMRADEAAYSRAFLNSPPYAREIARMPSECVCSTASPASTDSAAASLSMGTAGPNRPEPHSARPMMLEGAYR